MLKSHPWRAITLLCTLAPITTFAMSGGPCHYLPLETEGRVTAIEGFSVHLETPALGPISLESRYFSPLAAVGNRYRLQLQTLSEGACNPLQVDAITRLPETE
jgi:hypothetical protein